MRYPEDKLLTPHAVAQIAEMRSAQRKNVQTVKLMVSLASFAAACAIIIAVTLL